MPALPPRLRSLLLLLGLALGPVLAAAGPADPLRAAAFTLPQPERGLTVTPPEIERTVGPLELTVTFDFTVTNTSAAEIIVTQLRTSCGCSAPKARPTPWRLAPGATERFAIVVDLRGKRGVLEKQAFLDTATGYKDVDFRIVIPEPDPRDEMRLRNLMVAQADRQAVFKNDCAQCHADPTRGKEGRELFVAACAICHADEHRASMVPDLRTLAPAPTADAWRQIITAGKVDTLMPAFARENDGPLTRAQIDSLVAYLTTESPQEKPAAKKR